MFLSLVRPDRISSPMTRMPAVTVSAASPISRSVLVADRRCGTFGAARSRICDLHRPTFGLSTTRDWPAWQNAYPRRPGIDSDGIVQYDRRPPFFETLISSRAQHGPTLAHAGTGPLPADRFRPG